MGKFFFQFCYYQNMKIFFFSHSETSCLGFMMLDGIYRFEQENQGNSSPCLSFFLVFFLNLLCAQLCARCLLGATPSSFMWLFFREVYNRNWGQEAKLHQFATYIGGIKSCVIYRLVVIRREGSSIVPVFIWFWVCPDSWSWKRKGTQNPFYLFILKFVSVVLQNGIPDLGETVRKTWHPKLLKGKTAVFP